MTQDQRLRDFTRRMNGRNRGREINPAIRLPSLDELLRIDAQAEEAAARAVAGPALRQGELFTTEATIDATDAVDASDGRLCDG